MFKSGTTSTTLYGPCTGLPAWYIYLVRAYAKQQAYQPWWDYELVIKACWVAISSPHKSLSSPHSLTASLTLILFEISLKNHLIFSQLPYKLLEDHLGWLICTRRRLNLKNLIKISSNQYKSKPNSKMVSCNQVKVYDYFSICIID